MAYRALIVAERGPRRGCNHRMLILVARETAHIIQRVEQRDSDQFNTICVVPAKEIRAVAAGHTTEGGLDLCLEVRFVVRRLAPLCPAAPHPCDHRQPSHPCMSSAIRTRLFIRPLLSWPTTWKHPIS